MTVLHSLWLPILLSSVFVFIASSIIHMAIPWHKSDHAKLPQEDKAMEALRSLAIPPGDYMVPNCSNQAEMKTPEFKEKLRKGPVMVVTVFPSGPFGVGKSLAIWFIYLVVVSFFAAYVVCHALPRGARYPEVFRFAGVTSFLGYSAALWQMSIWYRRSWVTTIKTTVDGLIYAGLTAGTFGWLWMR
jgi:Na+/H+ antiporter NhaA